MIKSELIEKLAEQNPHLYRQDVEDLINAILDTITDALTQGAGLSCVGLACSRPSGAAHVLDEIRAKARRSGCQRKCIRCSRRAARCFASSIPARDRPHVAQAPVLALWPG